MAHIKNNVSTHGVLNKEHDTSVTVVPVETGPSVLSDTRPGPARFRHGPGRCIYGVLFVILIPAVNADVVKNNGSGMPAKPVHLFQAGKQAVTASASRGSQQNLLARKNALLPEIASP
jgi:hypothetical protein